jgi:nucleoside-diphosphate-sugar epimerase
MSKPGKIVVTGASGFIGAPLMERLIEAFPSAEVIGFSRTGGPGLIKADVTNPEEMVAVLAGAGWVFHLAAFTKVPDLLEDPRRGLAVNVLGTANVLEASRINGADRLVFVSTGRVLGIPKDLPAHEELRIAPTEPYSAQKASGETMAMAYHRAYGLGVTIVRPGTVYGPGRVMTPGSMSGVVPRFAEALLSGSPLTVVGEGSQRSDLTHVSDVVEGLILAAGHPRADGEIFHLGSETGTSIRELLDLMARAVGVEPVIEHLPAQADTIDSFYSNAKAGEVLGYSPQVKLADGLADYVEWLKANRKG